MTDTDEAQPSSIQPTPEQVEGELTIERAKEDVKNFARSLLLGLCSTLSATAKTGRAMAKTIDYGAGFVSDAADKAYEAVDKKHHGLNNKP